MRHGDRQVALHLGAHKTATTHLQQTLAVHRAQIAAAGWLCLLPQDLRGPKLRLGRLAAGGAEQVPVLRARIGGVARVLVSEENVLGTAHEPAMLRGRRFYPEAEARLARVLEAVGPAALHLALRDPAGFLVSAWSQRLFSGEIVTFDAFLEGCRPEALRWSELVARLMAVPGVDRCTVWRFEDWPGVAPRVLATMLPGVEIAPVEGVSHPGLSQRAHDMAMEELAAGRAGPDTARRMRARFPKGPGEAGFQPFTEAERQACAAAYAADVERVAAVPGVVVLGAGAVTGRPSA